MKHIYLLICLGFAGLFFTPVQGQSTDRCGTMDHLEWKKQQKPATRLNLETAETQARHWLDNNRNAVGGNVISIPTVVHILYKDPSQNLSTAQIQSQLDVLNADFRRLNADTTLTRPEFDSVAADLEIEFCLATTDPSGNSTTGITRTSTNGGQFFGYFGPTDDAKSGSTGGIDPWPTDQYLNIWVCDLLPILAGYAQFPGEDPSTDGVVIGYTVFGTIGDVSSPFNKGRTTTHEIGHWLGLRHIWGDGDCTMDDFVGDTPGADAANQGGCLNIQNTCTDSPVDFNDMVENYMDYSNDSCMNMYTEGQKARAWSFLNTDRLSLFSSNGCSLAVATSKPILSDELFILYPNPANQQVYLDFYGQSDQLIQVEVFSALGKTVLQQTKEFMSDKIEIDLSKLGKGTYFVKVISAEGYACQKLLLD